MPGSIRSRTTSAGRSRSTALRPQSPRSSATNVAAPMAAIHTLFNLITTFAKRVSSLVKSPRPTFALDAVQSESKTLHKLVRTSRRGQLNRVGSSDPNSPIRVLVELDILNAYERIRAYYLNIAETLAGGK